MFLGGAGVLGGVGAVGRKPMMPDAVVTDEGGTHTHWETEHQAADEFRCSFK